MYGMKEVCEKVGITYTNLKFYCNEGLIPNVKRDKNNRRIFDDRDVAWIQGLLCLKDCNFGIAEMKNYLQLCLEGESSIETRKKILSAKKSQLQKKIATLEGAIKYIDTKQNFYDGVLSGKIKYHSNLILTD